MIPAIVEKLAFVLALAVLYGQARIGTRELLPALPDLALGLLFVASYVTTGRQRG